MITSLSWLIHFSLCFVITECSRIILHILCSRPGVSHFSVLVPFCISMSSMRSTALYPLQYLVVTLNFFAILVSIYWYLNVILSCLSLIKIWESLASYIFSFMKYVAPNLLARNVACRSSFFIVNVSPLCLSLSSPLSHALTHRIIYKCIYTSIIFDYSLSYVFWCTRFLTWKSSF